MNLLAYSKFIYNRFAFVVQLLLKEMHTVMLNTDK
jgi:hypothetical protein